MGNIGVCFLQLWWTYTLTHSVSQVVFVRKLFDKTALFYVSMDPVLFRNQNYIRWNVYRFLHYMFHVYYRYLLFLIIISFFNYNFIIRKNYTMKFTTSFSFTGCYTWCFLVYILFAWLWHICIEWVAWHGCLSWISPADTSSSTRRGR